jgi:arylformamidase
VAEARAAGGWVDVSVAFDGATPPWPGDTPVDCGWNWSMADGASVNVSRWTLSPHVGTHADAPLHVRAGAPGADRLPLAPFIGEAFIADVRDAGKPLDAAALAALGVPTGAQRLLLRTGQGVAGGRFPASWPTLAADAVRALVAGGLTLLGVDAPSVDRRESTTLDVHHALFDGGAFVLENLDLRLARAGHCELMALPIRTGAQDAAPARAFVRAR